MGAQKPQRPPPGHAMLVPRVDADDTQRALDAVKQSIAQLQRTASALQTQLGGLRIVGTGTAPPPGQFKLGDVFQNSAPVAGGFFGWIWVTAGAWKTWGAISP